MPPHFTPNLLQVLGQSDLIDFDTTFLHQREDSTIRMGDVKKAQLATPEWNNTLLYSLTKSLGGRQVFQPSPTPLVDFEKSSPALRLNVKTHVFKKELQEYIPTQIEDRLRIETIIYVELSIVDQNNALVNAYDYARLPKDLFSSQPDKVMSSEELGTKRIVDIVTTLQCPSNSWKEEKEACLRCARRMSTKLDQTESRIMHLLPELHRTENGDPLISFRSGVANIQFKINCYCGHKKEKEGFVIRFDSQSDTTIASHVTLPLMFYHLNKSRVASRAIAAAVKAQAKSEHQQQRQQQPSDQILAARNIVKSITSKTKRKARSKPGNNPIGNQQHQIPSPPNSLLDSPVEWSSSPEMDDLIDNSDILFTGPSQSPPDPLMSLFPETATQEQQQQQPTIALISHMTPNSGPVRGGTLVTIHGTGFAVGEVMYVCFGENMVPIIPHRDHMLECITPTSNKAETVPVFAINAVDSNIAQTTFTYVDDNEKELIKLALQRMMNISARMEGPLDNVLNRANEFGLWSDLLESSNGGSSDLSDSSYSNLEKMVMESFELLDTAATVNVEGLSIVNSTGHTMLHLAVTLQYEALVKDLMARNIDMAVQDKNGLTALDWAHRLDSQTMVDLLSGVVAPTSVSVSVSKNPIASGKLAYTSEHDKVARSIQLLVSPGSYPQAIGQPNVGPSHSWIAEPSLCLAEPVDPHMDVEWEGFGQGPGQDVGVPVGVVSELFETQTDQGFFDQQTRQDAQCLTTHQRQQPQQDPARYSKALSAIPAISTGDSSTVLASVQKDTSPNPVGRILVGNGDKVGQQGIIVDMYQRNISIEKPVHTNCPIDGLNPARRLVGDFDRTDPIDQGVVATEGCTGNMDAIMYNTILRTGVEEDSIHQLFGVQGSGIQGSGIHNIQDTALVYNPVQDVTVSEADSSVGRSHNSATKQAVVQNSRNDDESEPLLFLGGLPVTLSPRPVRMGITAVSNASNVDRKESIDLPRQGQSWDEVDDSVKP